MKIKTLGYVLSVQKELPTPEQVEAYAMEEKERDCLINITAQHNQIKFLENIRAEYVEREDDDRVIQTDTSIDAASNTLLQWETQLTTIQKWHWAK